MLRQINIAIIDKIKKPVEGNKFLNGLLNVLTIILYPILIVFGLIYLLFIIVLGLFRNLTMTKQKKEEEKIEVNNAIDEWTIWTGMNGLNLFKKFRGEIRFGPPYLSLKSEPKIPELNDKMFGDWFFQYKNGLLLQQWNSTDSPDTDLIFIDKDSLEVQLIEKNIPSVLWDIVETEDQVLQLKCDTGKEIFKYKIEIKNGS